MKDFTPTEPVTCVDCENISAIQASCQGQCTLTGLRWDAELVRCENGSEWMRLNFDPVDQADYPKLYAYLEAGIKAYVEPSPAAKLLTSYAMLGSMYRKSRE